MEGVMASQPACLSLHESGELRRRAQRALAELRACNICPRKCGTNRLAGETGFCRTGRHAKVSSFFAHFGEEDCLRGTGGSGTIFFAACNLHCVFCQNADISQQDEGQKVDARTLADMMIQLQDAGCHNVNFVTPSHVVPQIIEAIPEAVEAGLRLPLVYNTNAYDSPLALELLDGIVDVYMPDFKYWSRDAAETYSAASDYPEVARDALREMHRQVGVLTMDEAGVAHRGVLVRHLVLPGDLAGTERAMHFLASELSPDTYVNIMPQYHAAYRAARHPELARRPTRLELQSAHESATRAGLHRLDTRRGPF